MLFFPLDIEKNIKFLKIFQVKHFKCNVCKKFLFNIAKYKIITVINVYSLNSVRKTAEI